jgi:hypothetical protein
MNALLYCISLIFFTIDGIQLRLNAFFPHNDETPEVPKAKKKATDAYFSSRVCDNLK